MHIFKSQNTNSIVNKKISLVPQLSHLRTAIGKRFLWSLFRLVLDRYGELNAFSHFSAYRAVVLLF